MPQGASACSSLAQPPAWLVKGEGQRERANGKAKKGGDDGDASQTLPRGMPRPRTPTRASTTGSASSSSTPVTANSHDAPARTAPSSVTDPVPHSPAGRSTTAPEHKRQAKQLSWSTRQHPAGTLPDLHGRLHTRLHYTQNVILCLM